MNITNEEIESHLNYPKPSDVTSMNINSIDVSFIILGWVSCVFDAGGWGRAVGLDWESLDSHCEIMISYFGNKTGKHKKIRRQKLRPRIL